MYPIYPFIVVLAIASLNHIASLVTNLLPMSSPSSRKSLRLIAVMLVIALSGVLGASRIISNFNNFYGIN